MINQPRLMKDGLAKIPEAMAFLGVSRATIYDLCESGDLPWVKLGRSRRIPRRALEQLAQRNLVGGNS